MRKYLFTLWLTLVVLSGFAQIQRNTGQVTGAAYSGGTVEAFSAVPESFPNDNYLYHEWYYGSINLKGSDIVDVKEIPIKYNVVRNTIEFKHTGVTKEIDLSAVNSFKLLVPNQLDPVNFESYMLNNQPSVLKVIFKGSKYSLFAKYDYDIIPADYNAQFDTGSKSDRVNIKEDYFIRDESDQSFSEIKLSKRGITKYFEDRDEIVFKHIKKNKPRITSESEAKGLLIEIDKI